MKSPTVTIRPEQAGDRAAIRAVNDAAFGGTVEGQIVDDLRGSDRWIDGGSLVAEESAGRVIGHVLLSVGDLVGDDGGVRPIWMLGPIAVDPARQGQGIGSALMKRAIGLAVERAQPVICLLGHATYYPDSGSSRLARSGSSRPARGRTRAGWRSACRRGTRRSAAPPGSRPRSPTIDGPKPSSRDGPATVRSCLPAITGSPCST
jgi:putative acetyltransferase